MTKVEWLNDIELQKVLDIDGQIIVKELGLDNYLKLIEIFGGTRVYFPVNILSSIKREFIVKNKNKYSIKEYCKMLEVSHTFVYNVYKGESLEESPE